MALLTGFARAAFVAPITAGIVAAIIGCHAAPAAPPAPSPAPVVADSRVPARRPTDGEWIDSVSREFGFAGRASPEEVRAAPHESRRRPPVSTFKSTLSAELAEHATGSIGVAPPITYADDTRPRTILAGIGLLSLIALIALTRRS